MEAYAEICGQTLARAHARSGDAVAISTYLGASDAFDRALASFAEVYADQNDRDYEALQAPADPAGSRWRRGYERGPRGLDVTRTDG